MKKYVIIGNGTAAVGCIEGIRRHDADGKITVISAEKHHVYSRPLISYLLEGKTDINRMKYRPDDFYETNCCEVLYGVCAEKIDTEAKKVTVSDGKEIKYDYLCIAAGSSPFVPPTDGMEKVKKKYSFMTLDDALDIEKNLDGKDKVLIVGAGLIGLKCAEGIYGKVAQITVCDLAPRILSSVFDEELAAAMQSHLESKGIKILTGDCVERYEGNKAIMNSGKEIDFDILITAVGVRANTSLASSAGIKCGRGIDIDSHCMTSAQGVYAAGDCTEGYDTVTGDIRVIAILPSAYMQGFCAGENMAGTKTEYAGGVPLNSLGLFGLHTMTCGHDMGGDCVSVRTDGNIRKFFIKDGVMTGFMLMGDCKRAGIYTSLVRDAVKLGNDDFEKIKNEPSTLIFLPRDRRKIFGGVV